MVGKGAPASIAFLVTISGLALMYWALIGFGIVSGSTPSDRARNLIDQVKS